MNEAFDLRYLTWFLPQVPPKCQSSKIEGYNMENMYCTTYNKICAKAKNIINFSHADIQEIRRTTSGDTNCDSHERLGFGPFDKQKILVCSDEERELFCDPVSFFNL